MSDMDYGAVFDDVLRHEEEKRRALSVLLEELRAKAGHHLAVQARMGDVASYVTSVPLRWIADKVGFAADLPVFREISEGSKRLAADPSAVEMLRQRRPDWRRQQEMTAYLAGRRHHKFPPLLLVAWQHWACKPDSDKWAFDGTATDDSLTLVGLEPTGTCWDLHDDDTLSMLSTGSTGCWRSWGFRSSSAPEACTRSTRNGEKRTSRPCRSTISSNASRTTAAGTGPPSTNGCST